MPILDTTKAIHKAADTHRSSMQRLVLEAIQKAQAEVRFGDLRQVFQGGNADAIESLLDKPLRRLENVLRGEINEPRNAQLEALATKKTAATVIADVAGTLAGETCVPETGDGALSLGRRLRNSVNFYQGVFYTTRETAQDIIAQLGIEGLVIEKGPRGFFVKNVAGQRFGPGGWK